MPAKPTPATAPKACLSPWLQEAFATESIDAQHFIGLFLQWKQDGEDESYFFGKDALNLQSSLVRHVHMVPLSTPDALAAWDTNWQRHRKRVSDRFLFYVDGGIHGYLLLYIVNDPGAHEFLSKKDAANQLVRSAIEAMADEFYHFGTVAPTSL